MGENFEFLQMPILTFFVELGQTRSKWSTCSMSVEATGGFRILTTLSASKRVPTGIKVER